MRGMVFLIFALLMASVGLCQTAIPRGIIGTYRDVSEMKPIMWFADGALVDFSLHAEGRAEIRVIVNEIPLKDGSVIESSGGLLATADGSWKVEKGILTLWQENSEFEIKFFVSRTLTSVTLDNVDEESIYSKRFERVSSPERKGEYQR